MAKVGTPRLPTGPKPGEIPLDEDKVLDPVIDPVIDPILNEAKKKLTEAKNDGKLDGKFEEFTKAAKIPPPPTAKFDGGRTQDKLFYDWMASLDVATHWIQLSWYLYRTWPRIDRPERERYIEIGTFPFDEQWLLDHHGSGSYLCIVCISGKPKGANKICQAHIEKLDHPDYPPKLNLSELDVNHPGNKTFVNRLIAEGKLRPDRSVANMTPQGGTLSDQVILKLLDRVDRNQVANLKDPKDAAITTAFEIIGKGNQAATQMMLDQMKQDDPEKLVKLMTLMMSMVPKPVEHKDEGSSYLKLFMDSQTKSLELLSKKDETIMQLMTKMFEAKLPTNNEDSFDKSLDRFTKLFELTGMLGGMGSGGKKSTLETVMQYTMPVAEKAFGVIQNLLAVRAQAENIKNGKAGGRTELVVSTASPQVNKVEGEGDEEIGEVQDETNTNTNANKDVRQVMQQSNEEQLVIITQGLKQIGPKIIEALDRKTSGSAFAEGIENFMGPAVYDQLAGLGKEKIVEIIKSDSKLWGAITTTSVKFPHRTERNFMMFIDDFIAYGSDEVIEEIQEPKTSSPVPTSKVGVIDDVVES